MAEDIKKKTDEPIRKAAEEELEPQGPQGEKSGRADIHEDAEKKRNAGAGNEEPGRERRS